MIYMGVVIEIRRARSDRNAKFYDYPYFTFYLVFALIIIIATKIL